MPAIETPPPVETPKIETPVTPVTPKPAVILEGGLQGVLKSANLKKKSDPVKEPVKTPEPVTPDNRTAEEKAAAEKAASDKLKTEPAAVPEKKEVTPTDDKSLETNIVKLRETLDTEAKGRKEAETKYAALQAEIENLRKNPIPEDTQKHLQSLEERNAELTKVLRAASIERDPEFVAKFHKGRQEKLNTMFSLLKESGVEEATAMKAFRSWNEDAFGEWMEAMPPGQRESFRAAWNTVRELDNQRSETIANADKEWEKMTAANQERLKESQRIAQENITKTAKSVVTDLFQIEGLPEDPEFRSKIEEHVMQAAGLKDSPEPWDDARWLKTVALNQALGHATMALRGEVDTLTAQIQEKDKKIAELEAFVKDRSGSAIRVPGSGPTEPSGDGDKRPLWERVSVKVP